jgi:hypothetical protein
MTGALAALAETGRDLRPHWDHGAALHRPCEDQPVGLIMDIPDTGAFQQFMQSDEAAEAMRFDGIRPDTLAFLEEASGHL